MKLLKGIAFIVIGVFLFTCIAGCGAKEVKLPDVDKRLNQFTSPLQFSDYKEDGDDIKVELTYDGEVLLVGQIEQIRNIISSDLGSKYKIIELKIFQTKPNRTGIEYKYEDGKWDKEVE